MSTRDPLGTIEVEGWRVETIGEILSTNQLAAERAIGGESAGYAVIADHQTAGKGRRGNRWESPAGAALLLSAVLRPEAPLGRWPRLAVAAAVAAVKAIMATTSLRPSIKWPNDILVDGRKVAGILVESQAPGPGGGGWAVVGIGMNVHTRCFPLGLRYPATSLLLSAGHAPSRADLAAEFLKFLALETNRALGDGWSGILADYAAHDALAGKSLRAEYLGNVTEGRSLGLDQEGGLVLDVGRGLAPIIMRDAHGIMILGE